MKNAKFEFVLTGQWLHEEHAKNLLALILWFAETMGLQVAGGYIMQDDKEAEDEQQ